MLVFDMDGVLIDSEPLWRRVETECFSELGLEIEEADCAATMGMRMDEAVAWWFERQPWRGPSVSEVARRIETRMLGKIRSDGRPMVGTLDALKAARDRGWRLALASSSARELIETVLECFSIRGAFEVVHSAEEEKRGKPAPDVYLTTARLLGVDPTDCIAIEDSANGVTSALAAGMRCVAVPEPAERANENIKAANWQLATLEELPALLDRLGGES